MTNKERKRIDDEESFQDRLYKGYFVKDRTYKTFAHDKFGTILVKDEDLGMWRKAHGKELSFFAELVKDRIKIIRRLPPLTLRPWGYSMAMPVADGDEMAKAYQHSSMLKAAKRHERKLAKTKTRASKSGGR